MECSLEMLQMFPASVLQALAPDTVNVLSVSHTNS